MEIIKFSEDRKKQLIIAIKQFFLDEWEIEIGDLKASQVLEFCSKEIGPGIYNQAILDAQAFMQERVSDLEGVLYEPDPLERKLRQ